VQAKAIRRAAVIGSGTMGAGIAAHLSNSGIPCLLLDIVPKALTPAEEAAGLTLSDRKVRNRLAAEAVERLKKAKPSAFYDAAFADRIQVGNTEDDWAELAHVDWIIEVVPERLEVKQDVLARIEQVWQPGTIVSTNTSGLSIRDIAASCGPDLKRHFLGTHFFNPPRYMKLLEIIPGEATDPEIIRQMADFCERKLGKGVVIAKDTPNFIANRVGVYTFQIVMEEMLAQGLKVEEVDAVTGPAIGRPKSATFRTMDMVGNDVNLHVIRNLLERIPDGPEASAVNGIGLLEQMVQNGWLGDKSGQGFYRKVGKERFSLNLKTMEYEPVESVSSESLDAAKKAQGAAGRLKALLSVDDRYSRFAWSVLKQTFVYCAEKLGEIADSVADIDSAMKWGYNWELGPFELWDAIGLVPSVEKMEAEGVRVPAWVKDWIAAGNSSFYKRESGKLFSFSGREYRELEQKPEIISLQMLKENNRLIRGNEQASLIDLGDGVACLEFHTKGNAIDAGVSEMIIAAAEEVERNYVGLVIANEGKNFCVGANIQWMLQAAAAGKWDDLHSMTRQFQSMLMRLKYLPKPVVAAPHRMTLGGGAEVCLAADRILFSPETYFGLVEVGVGLIPAGGGTKEMALRASQAAASPEDDIMPAIIRGFQTIALAKTSTSGHDVRHLGYMRPTDRVIANQDYRVYEAKRAVLEMAERGYEPPLPPRIRIAGDSGYGVLKAAIYDMGLGGYATEYDQFIASKLAWVITGGNLPAGTVVTEQYMLDLEREAFVSLLQQEKTQQRIMSILMTGRHLRN